MLHAGVDGRAADTPEQAGPYPESVVVLAAAAGVTERIQLGFGVMILALRHPAWAAKQVAALQHVSGGRVVIGGETVELPSGASITLSPGAEVPPILVAGNSPTALRQAIRHGAGWFTSMPTPEEIADRARQLPETAP